MRSLKVSIGGAARPQGSKSAYVIRGRAVLVESNKDLKKMRAQVSAIIQQQAYLDKWLRVDRPNGVTVIVSFFFTPPKCWSNKKTEAALAGSLGHTVKPDIDKTMRYLLDAITDAGNVWEDDSQVNTIIAEKAYAENAYIQLEVKANV